VAKRQGVVASIGEVLVVAALVDEGTDTEVGARRLGPDHPVVDVVAGPIVHRLSPSGVLLGSAVFAGLGLLLLSYAGGLWSFGAAAVFAIGITYFWPTMLGFVNENIPQSGALGLAIMGGIGFLGGAIAQPVLGRIYDLKVDALNDNLAAGSATLRTVIVLTVILTIAFTFLYFRQRKKKTEV